MADRKHQVVIVGGGAGGLSTAACLLKKRSYLDIVVIEPSSNHYYQPAWTLVGGGAFDINKTRRNEGDCIAAGVKWIQKRVAGFEPDKNAVVLDDQSRVEYDYLIVAAGIQLDWNKIEGLEETLGKNGVTSNYRFDLAAYTWDCVRNMNSGRAVFTQPVGPIKCAGAPQKILYLAADNFRKRGVRVGSHFCTAGGAMFGVAPYAEALSKVMEAYDASAKFQHNLVAVDGDAKVATFEVGADKEKLKMRFDMLHVVPPQSAPDFIKQSSLANEAGWVAVNKGSMQHDKYANIFGLGDCTSTPNSKTAAAVRAQVPVVVENLVAAIEGKQLGGTYHGYAACPVTTSKGKVMICEFSYGGVVTPSFPLDPRKPRRSYWGLKRYYFPTLYWRMLKGNMGPYNSGRRPLPPKLPKIAP